ncbi:FliG C-terminal domain-containing protein [Rubripirellula reticaptiva]|uniref:Flagellar motor switch protein G n=1 Tax=Rubripirellula reticaptiva TaxID=2528013 RepID=A0A5C6FBK8_9BACT|nr:FliG C-terminal domain-containing protein [Rubripirellula reticaptiva]TWU57516.1 flagellar motor switch protein G [Rubripirellula reticaptiva]
MAGSANTDAANRDAAMRRIAIVLTSLPAPVAAKLLGTIDQDSKQVIRRTMATLSDVDPLERHRALQAFKTSVQQPAHQLASDRYSNDTFLNQSDPSYAQASRFSDRNGGSPSVLKSQSPIHDRPADPTSPLAFLCDVEDDDLIELLSGEHAQAVALVLASVAPSQAARILPRLEPTLRSSALSRLGRLSDIPETASAEVAQHFRNQLSQRTRTSASANNGSGRRALDAILSVMPKPEQSDHDSRNWQPTHHGNGEMHADPSERQAAHTRTAQSQSTLPPLVHSRADGPHAVPPLHAAEPRASESRSASDRNSVDEFYRQTDRANDEFHRLRVAPQTVSQIPSHADDTANGVTPNNSAHEKKIDSAHQPTQLNPLDSTDAIHSHLVAMKPKDLCTALGRVETRDAMLTLCGLPNAKAEAVLAVLPKDQAKVVRVQMNSLQSMNLREIDKAKERVAIASGSGSAVPANQASVSAAAA